MWTTIRISDDLYREVKASAAQSGRTAAAVLENAVRMGMDTGNRRATQPCTVHAIGSGGRRAGVDLSSNAVVAEAFDEGAHFDALP
ncbi:CopG family transcriptional regulator [Mycolicibacterium sp.]|uniref:CopG family transcriptional regulator n=1 Tax=Mycolicibacterium sp. TaxID=2320850 RepID=UPI0025EEC99C|nr:CopG family transcriptional regulator [Mycolicibacterium sp.]MCB9409611.1 CopG family transcriptional regulator [Mycolicibacterium sp.]